MQPTMNGTAIAPLGPAVSIEPVLLSNLFVFLSSSLSCRHFCISMSAFFDYGMKNWFLLQKFSSRYGLLLSVRTLEQVACQEDVSSSKVANIYFSAEMFWNKSLHSGTYVVLQHFEKGTLSQLPRIIATSATFLTVKVGDHGLDVFQVLQPSTILEPSIYHLASFDYRSGQWTFVGSIPSLLSTSLSNEIITVSFKVPISITEKQLEHIFLSTVVGQSWILLFDKFNLSAKVMPVVINDAESATIDIDQLTDSLNRGDYDFSADLVLISAERIGRLGFILVGADIRYYLMIRKPEYSYSSLAMARPWTNDLWFSYFSIIVLFSLVIWFVSIYTPSSTFPMNLSSSLMIGVGFSCNQASLGLVKNLSLQFALASGLLFFFVANQFYVSTLYSMLSTREINPPFNSIEEFIEKKSHRLMISSKTSIYQAIKSAPGGILKDLWDRFLSNDGEHQIDDTEVSNIMNRLCDGSTAVLALPQYLPLYQRKCPLYALLPGYFPNQLAMATRKNYPYLKHFQLLFMRSIEVGIAHYVNGKFIDPLIIPFTKINRHWDPEPVSFEQVAAVNVVFFGMCLISIIILLFERCFWRRRLSILPTRVYIKH